MTDPDPRRPGSATAAPTARPPRRPGPPADPGLACVHRLFRARARANPGAIALVVGDERLTYAELDARADRLARRLVAMGVGPEVPVGIFAERSAAMVVAILGVLKAGGAYVPLDPAYPAERIGLILDDAKVPVLLTQAAVADRLPSTAAEVVLLEEWDGLDVDPEATPVDGGAGPGNLAYVIYTSGSTGRPKGVGVTHANVARLLGTTRRRFGFGPSDVWTLFHSFAFDFSVWELWGALAFGGKLVVVPYWISRSPGAFLDLLGDERVTVLNQTPSAFRALIHAEGEADSAAEPLALRLVIFGGEALELKALGPWFDRHGDEHPRLVNMYGITETTVHVTDRPIARVDLEPGGGASPIGRPIPDLRVYLLDPRMEPVPIGVVGEIYVGGPGVARGYLGRPGLTAERFLPDPFGSTPGARLYRSGDLARRRPDGDLDYVGRADDQVKVRGFRIELGDVEAAIVRQPGVREATVVARPGPGGDARLVAYLTAIAGGPPVAEVARGLRDALASTLPAYMIPSAFVPMGALPLTEHGKVDRAALPDPGGIAGRARADYVEPRTGAEARVAASWRGVLGVEKVGALDHFFDLGGHSLLATQVASRLRDAFGFPVPVRLLFEAPTVAGLAARLEGMDGSTGGRAVIAPRIERRAWADGEARPVSFAHESLWYLDRLAPGESTFNVSASAEVVGPLDLDALRRSFDELTRRHEALRTRFGSDGGRPVAIVTPAGLATMELEVVDLASWPEADRRAEAGRRASAEARRAFDLEAGPLARATVFRIGAESHAVLLAMHHIVTDGWSLGVAAAELAAIYPAFRDGLRSPLPEPALQYSDYAAWQRSWLAGEPLDALVGYWKAHLDGIHPLDLPTDRPRPPVRSSRGALVRFELPRELSERVVGLGRSAGATPFMTLLAAFQALLGRTAGQEIFAVGSPIANRNRAEVEGLVGYFVNMLALRADLSGDPSFLELIGRVREAALGGYEHQDLPLELLVEAIAPPRDPSRTPLFQAMFVLQNNPMPDVSAGELALAPFGDGDGTGTAKFDLSMALAETDAGLVGSIEYAADLFDPATIDRLVARFRAFLGHAVDSPDRPISTLDPAPAADLAAIALANSNTPASVGSSLHGLFEARAKVSPGAIAVEGNGASLSYQSLDRAANRLARRLVDRGVGAESRVGVGVGPGRAVELAVGLLAVLKAGGAFVPLDPDYPEARLRAMADDAGIALILAPDEPAALGRWADLGLPCEVVPLAIHPGEPGDDAPIGRAVDPEGAAYVLFTSGSTGRPKGVVVPHRAVANHAVAAARLFDLTPADRVLQFASPSFDIAIEELFPAWSAGATVVSRGPELLAPAEFAAAVDRDRITVLDLPTAYWHAWVAGLSGDRLPECLRLVIVGGEEALVGSLATWRELGGDRVRWINTYGPTEATVIATAFEPGRNAEVPPTLPIGRPIAGARAHVLDPAMEPTPIGVPGELYLGGIGVARGYLGRPGATASAFVPDPFGAEPGDRLYRTGDRARWRDDGTLEFLGRVDEQVKVRGYRVEPGEVESALVRLPGVGRAVVVARDGVLAAYVAPVDGDLGAIDPEAIRRALRETLPPPMVPTWIIPLTRLPTTPSGKVDRRALPTPDRPTGPGSGPVAPRDPNEAKLLAIWEDLLPSRPIGVHDDFFDLGGHSLLALRLLARIEGETGRSLPLSALLRAGTIARLAEAMGEAERGGSGPAWSPLVPFGTGVAPFYCIHPAGGIVYCYGELARRLGPGVGLVGVQAVGLEGDRPPLNRVEAIAASYLEAIRASGGLLDGRPIHLGGWSFGGTVAFEMARQVEAAGGTPGAVVLLDAEAPGATPRVATSRAIKLAAELSDLGLFGESDGADPRDEALLLDAFGIDLARGVPGGAKGLAALLRRLDPDARRLRLIRHFGLDAVYHLETGPERVGRLLGVLRASVIAANRYAPTGRLEAPVVVVRARDRDGRPGDRSLGWGRLVAGEVTAIDAAGTHDSILQAPVVDRLAEAIRDAIARAESKPVRP